MSDKDNGGYVFPRLGGGGALTLRDWFASMAITGLLAGMDPERGGTKEDLVLVAYQYADLMLEERDK